MKDHPMYIIFPRSKRNIEVRKIREDLFGEPEEYEYFIEHVRAYSNMKYKDSPNILYDHEEAIMINSYIDKRAKEDKVKEEWEKVKEDFVLTANDLINDRFVLLQSGKKNYFVIRVV